MDGPLEGSNNMNILGFITMYLIFRTRQLHEIVSQMPKGFHISFSLSNLLCEPCQAKTVEYFYLSLMVSLVMVRCSVATSWETGKLVLQLMFSLNILFKKELVSFGLAHTPISFNCHFTDHHSIAWWGYQLIERVLNGGLQPISEILHIEYRIVCCIETYLIHIYHMSKCSKCKTGILKDFVCEMCIFI